MPETIRQSPLHDLLQTAPPPGGAVQAERLRRVGLCDVSLLEKLGLKGPDAATWLGDQGLAVPAEVYASGSLEAGGLVVRLGADEFLLEAGSLDRSLTPLRDALPVDSAQLVPVVREDATLLLCGLRALDLSGPMLRPRFFQEPLGPARVYSHGRRELRHPAATGRWQSGLPHLVRSELCDLPLGDPGGNCYRIGGRRSRCRGDVFGIPLAGFQLHLVGHL